MNFGQLNKPEGDDSKWRPRDYDTPKWANNQRNGLMHQLHKAEVDFRWAQEEFAAYGLDEDRLVAAEKNLLVQYEKLYLMDEHGLVYLDANEKRGRPHDIRFDLNEEQIERINLVAGAIGTPDPAVWQRKKGSRRCSRRSVCPS